ncbi:MAG: amidase [Caldilineaceae bacterium]
MKAGLATNAAIVAGSGSSLTEMSATELAHLIRSGHVSAREVVDAHIARIEAVDDKLNAVVIRLFDAARAEADEADRRRAQGAELGPLHGVPVTIKEQFRVAGTVTSCGFTDYIHNVCEDEGPLVRSLRQAGAIILGKTNVMQALGGWECDNPVYGRANNPWDLARTPGGSSGGEAAIIAAAGSPFGLASDLGGSIRFPAYFCGVHGFKPTAGRFTNEDTPAGIFGLGQEAILPQPGPIARRVEDLSLMLSVLSTAESKYDVTPPLPWNDPAKVDVSRLRIGYFTDNGYFSASPSIRRAVEEAAAALNALGADVVQMRAPDTEEGMRLFVGIFSADGSAGLKRSLHDDSPVASLRGTVQGASIPNSLRPTVSAVMARRSQRYRPALIRYAGSRSTEEYWKLVEARTIYRGRFLGELADNGIDAVLSPPFGVPAPLHDSTEHLLPAGSYGLIWSVLGMPVGVVSTTRVRRGEESDRSPSGDITDMTALQVEQHSRGLPVGVQVAARHWHDEIALAVMAALEERFRRLESYPTAPAAVA